MRTDRVTKLLLALIAAGLWVLILSSAGLPEMAARAEASFAPSSKSAHQQQKSLAGSTGGPKAPTSTLPLRWRIPTSFEDLFYDETYCSTVVSVTNPTTITINVEVEWITYFGYTAALRPMAVAAEEMLQWATNNLINLRPNYADDSTNLAAGPAVFLGHANVNADDPRILVTATLVCRDGTAAGAKIIVQNEIPAFPVGATAEFSQAGMPATWTPPMAAPELPE
jgi:hypothetical protein